MVKYLYSRGPITAARYHSFSQETPSSRAAESPLKEIYRTKHFISDGLISCMMNPGYIVESMGCIELFILYIIYRRVHEKQEIGRAPQESRVPNEVVATSLVGEYSESKFLNIQ